MKIDLVELRRLIDEGDLPTTDEVAYATWCLCYDTMTDPDNMRIILDELERLQIENAQLTQRVNSLLMNQAYMRAEQDESR